MAHCHIAEHHEGGMMFSFRVEPSATAASRELNWPRQHLHGLKPPGPSCLSRL